jgi:SAM-dependent methyltransferase
VTQNKYDDDNFFQAYSKLPRSVLGLGGAAEWPTMRALLPPLRGAQVLDLGCGFGWFCRWSRAQGAASVQGIDVSTKMLERARRDTDDPAIRYVLADLEQVTLPTDAFDLVYSSLTLHYLADLDRIVQQMAAAVVRGGAVVCSVEHPIFSAPSRPGWVTFDDRRVWPMDGYSRRGPRVTDWLAPGVVKHHRTIGDHVAALVGAGLRITGVIEWAPDAHDIEAHPEWEEELDRPTFLLLAAQREDRSRRTSVRENRQ